jgi:hypothetical protein
MNTITRTTRACTMETLDDVLKFRQVLEEARDKAPK